MNKKAPLLTVAMPVYNGGNDLRIALLSIIKQSFVNWELLLIDDGSTDNSTTLISNIDDSRIKLISDGENKGLAYRLNEAIDLAKGKYFARMDQDDICHPERFKKQILFMENNTSIDLLGTCCVTINKNNEVTGRLPLALCHNDLCTNPSRGFYLPHPTWLGKTAWFQKHRYKNPGPYCCEDQELLLRTYKCSKFHALAETLLAYRLRKNTPLKKMWLTRKTLFSEQARYFISIKDYLSISKSFITFFSKIIHDIFKKISRNEVPAMLRHATPEDIKEWNKIIHKIEKTN